MGLPASGSRNDELNGFLRGRRWKEYRGYFQDVRVHVFVKHSSSQWVEIGQYTLPRQLIAQ